MKNPFFQRILARLQGHYIGKLFFHKKFFYYTWTSVFISLLNIFLIWLFIDIFHIPTIISSTAVIATTFLTRYFLFDYFEVL